MAFLLPLELLGAAIVGATEEFIGTKVAQTIAGIAVAKVGDYINSKLYDIAESVVGAQNAQDLKDAVSQAEEIVYESLTNYSYGSQEWMEALARNDAKRKEEQRRKAQAAVDALKAAGVNQGSYAGGPSGDSVVAAPVLDIDPMEVEPSVGPNVPVSEEVDINSTDPPLTEPVIYEAPPEVATSDPTMVADIIADHVDLMISNNYGLFQLIDAEGKTLVPTKSIQEINKELVGDSDEKLSYFQKMSSYYADKSLSKSEEFKEIFSAYNGQGITPSGVVWSENNESWFYDLYDEKGLRMTLEQRKDAYTVPAVYGTFGGAFSPNNQPPRDIPDTIFMAHDWGFSVSYFLWQEDMKLVSRLVQNRDKWPLDSVNLLNNIVIYFSTVGATIATIKGSIVGDPSKAIIEDEITDDIFPVMVPDALNLPKNEYLDERYKFYLALSDRLEERRVNNVLINNPDSVLRQSINNLNITLL